MSDDTDPPSLPFTAIDPPIEEEPVVGLIREDDDAELVTDGYETVTLDPEYLIEFAERCVSMDWEKIELCYGVPELPVYAREKGDESGMYVAIAPFVNNDDEDNGGGE